ncbi:MAG: hypothetical protein R6V53_05540 [Candidatus Woesearchaeota archaeon]
MKQKQTMYLTAEAIYKYILGIDEDIETLIMCKSGTINLLTTDQSLYEAIGSIEDRSSIDYNKIVKLLEVTEIRPFRVTMKKDRTILTEDRVNEIKKAGEE